MSDAPSAHIDLTVRTIAFRAQIASVKRVLTGLRDRMATVARHARRMLMIGGGAIAGFLVLAGKQEEAERKLDAILRARGEYTAVYSQHLRNIASEIQKLTVYGDEYTLGLMAQISALGVTADRLEDATRGTLGLSAALGIDARSAARYFALAMQGEYTVLQRYIPALRQATTAEEKHAIVTKFAAQGFEVAKEAALTFRGQLLQLKNSLGDLGEQIGFVFLPGVIKFAGKVRDLIPRISDWVKGNKNLILSTAKWAAGIAAAIVVVHALSTALIAAYTAAVALGSAPVIAALAALAAGLSTVGFQALKAKASINTLEEEAVRYIELVREYKKAKEALEEAGTPIEKISALQSQATALKQLIAIEKRRRDAALEEARKPGPHRGDTERMGILYRQSEKAARAAELLENKLNMVNVALEKQKEAAKKAAGPEAVDESAERTKKFNYCDLTGLPKFWRGLRRLAGDIADPGDEPQDESAPLLKFGSGGDFTKEIHGKEGALLSPPESTVSPWGERCFLFEG